MIISVLQNARIFKNSKCNQLTNIVINRNSTVPQAINAVFLERNLNEEIIISIPKEITSLVDLIGPPHPVSNLRPVIWYRSVLETSLERRLKDLQETTQNWNQRFWELHNSNFINERKLYIKNHLIADSEKQTLTSDEMSEFYKEFLDKNWKNHVAYNFEWYKRNFTILFLSIGVLIEKFIHRT